MPEGDALKAAQFSEAFTNAGTALRVDREKGVIYGVKILGLQSRNPPPRNYSYPLTTHAKAVPLLEGAVSNVDHHKPGEKLSYRDRLGIFRKVHTTESGTFGDYHYNPKHELAEQLAWDAENAPEKLGFSIQGGGKINFSNRGHPIVEEIEAIKSVDLVANPATCHGLYEAEDDDEIPEEQREFCEHGFSAVSDLQAILRSKEPQEDKASRVRAVLSEWAAELPGEPINHQEIKTMEWKDLTLAGLQENRKDLYEQITGTDEASKAKAEAKALSEQLEVAKTALKAATDERDTLKAANEKAARSAAIAEELKAAGVKTDDKEVCTEALMAQLSEAVDTAARAPIVALMALAQKARTVTPTSAPFADLSGKKPDSATVEGRSWR